MFLVGRQEESRTRSSLLACETSSPDWQPLDAVRDIVWARADTVVWVDPPRHRVMRQLVARTLRRMANKQELWNGNQERWRYLFRSEESVIRYAWMSHSRYRARYFAAQADPANAHLTFLRLRTPAETAVLMRDLAPA